MIRRNIPEDHFETSNKIYTQSKQTKKETKIAPGKISRNRLTNARTSFVGKIYSNRAEISSNPYNSNSNNNNIQESSIGREMSPLKIANALYEQEKLKLQMQFKKLAHEQMNIHQEIGKLLINEQLTACKPGEPKIKLKKITPKKNYLKQEYNKLSKELSPRDINFDEKWEKMCSEHKMKKNAISPLKSPNSSNKKIQFKQTKIFSEQKPQGQLMLSFVVQ